MCFRWRIYRGRGRGVQGEREGEEGEVQGSMVRIQERGFAVDIGRSRR